jgi:plastocyanin
MVLEGAADYKYVPSTLNIKVGDRIVFHNVSGFPHNVSFWPDSIPAGAQPVLEPQLPNPIGPLQSELLLEAGRTVTLSFAGAPTGEYKFYCTPHLAMGMRGTITVSQ